MKLNRIQTLRSIIAALMVLAVCLSAPVLTRAESESPAPTTATIGLATQDEGNEDSKYYNYKTPFLGKPKDKLQLWIPVVCTGGSADNVSCALITDLSGAVVGAGTIEPGSASMADGEKAYFCLPLTLKSEGAFASNLDFNITYDGGESRLTLPNVKVTVEPALTPTPDASGGDSSDVDHGITYESGGSSGGGSSFKSKPKVIVSGYTFDSEKLYAGESFKMTLKLRNTSEREAVKNLQLNFSNEAGVVLPISGGSNSIFIGDLAKKSVVSMNIGLQIAPDAEPKTQMLNLEITYEGTKNKQDFTEKSTIAIPILQKTRVRTDEPVFYDEAWAGQSCSMSVQMFNMGKSSLYNCMVAVEGEGLSLEETYYAGNIASGGTMRADLTLLTQTVGEIEGVVRITYEDVYGDQNEELLPFTLTVNEEVPMEPAFAENGSGVAGVATGGNAALSALAAIGQGGAAGGLAWYWLALIVAGLLALVILLIVKLKRRRARMLEEDLSQYDDDYGDDPVLQQADDGAEALQDSKTEDD